jgi:hypothetical protein
MTSHRLSRMVIVAVGAASSVGAARRLAARRRRIASMPIGIARSAGITFRRCRRLGSLQQRAALHPVGQPFRAH